jgi:hypothetical protein
MTDLNDDGGVGKSNLDEKSLTIDDDDQFFYSLWRLDPSESHSDWTIILHEEEGEVFDLLNVSSDSHDRIPTTIFHVHKIMLGVGPYKSEYFSQLFRQCAPAAAASAGGRLHCFSEYETSTSHIYLPPSAIVAFPIMLDFIYGRGCTTACAPFQTCNAVEIRFLSTYFDVPTLYSAISEFIQSDLTTSNCSEYLRNAMVFRDDKLIEDSCATCAKNFDHLTESQVNSLSPDHELSQACWARWEAEKRLIRCRGTNP